MSHSKKSHKRKRSSSDEERNSSIVKKVQNNASLINDFHLELEKRPKNEIPKKPLTWPNHMLIFGATQAGKTRLIANLLDNVEEVYDFNSASSIEERKLVVVSPIPQLEIAEYMTTRSLWDLELYNDLDLNEDFEKHLKKCFLNISPRSINILLLDDVLTQAKSNQIIFLNKWFSYFRHINVSIIATVHSYDIKFLTIIDQTAMIVAMYCLNTSTVLRHILGRCLYKGTAKVWSEIRRIFLANLKKHDYICMNFSKEALSSEIFFITDTLFNLQKGLKLQQIVYKM